MDDVIDSGDRQFHRADGVSVAPNVDRCSFYVEMFTNT